MSYVHQAWPSWRYGPNGESAIFQGDDEVPAGWLDHPAKFNEPVKAADAITQPPSAADAAAAASNDEKISALIATHSQTELVALLDAMKELDDSLEYATNWPKLRLATTIVTNGGPLEN
jgi:hypothetical protein